jgi:hypothetical protein
MSIHGHNGARLPGSSLLAFPMLAKGIEIISNGLASGESNLANSKSFIATILMKKSIFSNRIYCRVFSIDYQVTSTGSIDIDPIHLHKCCESE